MKRSDGGWHERNAIIILIILIIVAVSLVPRWWALGLILGGILGLFIDPDLDMQQTTRAEWRVYRVLGDFFGALFHAYWTIYGAMFDHRSIFTHGGFPPLGCLVMILVATPIRIIYTFIWLIVICFVSPTVLEYLSLLPLLFYVSIYLGWAAQDLGHWARDYLE